MDRNSKLKVLQTVVTLEKFTAGVVMARTGLVRTQVDPQLARLRREGIIEYDPESAATDPSPRTGRRRQRYYRLARAEKKRRDAFDEIRSVRAALGEDDSAREFLGTIQGQIETLQGLLSSMQKKGAKLDRVELEEYERQLERTDHGLKQATLENLDAAAPVRARIAELKKAHEDSRAMLAELEQLPSAPAQSSAAAAGAISPGFCGVRTMGLAAPPGLAHWLRDILTARGTAEGAVLPDPEKLSTEVRGAARELRELDGLVMSYDPGYTNHARLDYAVCNFASKYAPEPEILLATTRQLRDIAPRAHKQLYKFNYANLLAWNGQEKEAFEQWQGCLRKLDRRAPFRISMGALIDPDRFDQGTWEEVEQTVNRAKAIVSLASKFDPKIFEMGACCPEPILKDPFVENIQVAADPRQTGFLVYGVGFSDLYRRQPGLSYSRLATLLYRLGLEAGQAWEISQNVDGGKTLLLVGETKISNVKPEAKELSSLMRDRWGAVELSAFG